MAAIAAWQIAEGAVDADSNLVNRHGIVVIAVADTPADEGCGSRHGPWLIPVSTINARRYLNLWRLSTNKPSGQRGKEQASRTMGTQTVTLAPTAFDKCGSSRVELERAASY